MFARNIGYNCHCARGQQLCPRVGVIRKRQRSCERVTSHAVELPRAVAVDVEYAHFSVCGRVQTAAAEVCLVREDCSIVLEGFVCPDISRQDNARWFGGIKPEKFRSGYNLSDVKYLIEQNLLGCLLVGYGLSKDLQALQVEHPLAMQRELMTYRKFQSGRGAQARKLQHLALEHLGSEIQSAGHSAREDANTVMKLYLNHVRNDLAQLSYDQLVQLETWQLMQSIAKSRSQQV